MISFQSDEGAILKKFVSLCTGKRKEMDVLFDHDQNLAVAKILARFGHAVPESPYSCTSAETEPFSLQFLT